MKQAKVLSKQELKRVLALCNTIRNRLALLLSHYAGLRVGEIASLYWNDVIDQSVQVKTDFYLKPENTKANEARQIHLNVMLQKELGIFWQILFQPLRGLSCQCCARGCVHSRSK